jgi:hypothetical protein
VAASLDVSLKVRLVELDRQVVDSATSSGVRGHAAEALALAVSDLGWPPTSSSGFVLLP